MSASTRDELQRQLQRDYERELESARSTIAVLAEFVRGREARPGDGLMEEAFAATPIEGADPPAPLPAAVWVTLRHGDLDSAVETLRDVSSREVVVGEHEQLDATYRLTTIQERRRLPDVDLLQRQLAAFLAIPADVIAVIASWGVHDPRTADEIESLLDQRYGPAPRRPRTVEAAPPPPATEPVVTQAAIIPTAGAQPATSSPAAGQRGVTATADATPSTAAQPEAAPLAADLSLSSAEFIALLQLTPEQGAVLDTLVRQTSITIHGMPGRQR